MRSSLAERNLDVVTSVMHYILSKPQILDQLPPDFRLVILPDDDPELSRHNLDLLRQGPPPEKPVVIVRLFLQAGDMEERSPQIYAPVAV
jgi:hypothetical protein